MPRACAIATGAHCTEEGPETMILKNGLAQNHKWFSVGYV